VGQFYLWVFETAGFSKIWEIVGKVLFLIDLGIKFGKKVMFMVAFEWSNFLRFAEFDSK